MNAEHLSLTSYFGERERIAGRFFADAQLELFGRHEIATSVLLRGISGFGLKHHFRADQQVTLSEDLPLVSVAVDSRRKIERLVDELAGLGHRGLVTVERARLLHGVTDPDGLPEVADNAAKLTIYVGRHEQVRRVPAFVAVCELLHRRGIDTATVLLGADGTSHGRRARGRFFGRNPEVPVMVVAIGLGDRIARVIPELGSLLRHPLMSVERVQVCKRNGQRLGHLGATAGLDDNGVPMWQKLTVYTSAGATHEGEPVHRALVGRLRGREARGVTVLSGIWGFHDSRAPHGDQIWKLGRDAPMCTILLDTPQRLARSFGVIDEVTATHGVVVSETVPALIESTGGPARRPRLSRSQAQSETGARPPAWRASTYGRSIGPRTFEYP